MTDEEKRRKKEQLIREIYEEIKEESAKQT